MMKIAVVGSQIFITLNTMEAMKILSKLLIEGEMHY